MSGAPWRYKGIPRVCRGRLLVSLFFLHFFFRFFFRFFLSVRVVCGWCVVCRGIEGLLDVRGRCEEVNFHVPAGGGVTKRGEGRCLLARTWPDWPGGTVSVQRDLLYRRGLQLNFYQSVSNE